MEGVHKGQIVHLYNALGAWACRVKLGERVSGQNTEQLFGINLGIDAPPMPLKFLHVPQGANVRVMDLRGLMMLLAQTLDTVPTIDSPLLQGTELTRNALLWLQTNWGMQAQRKSARATRNEVVNIEMGLKDIHKRINYLRTSPETQDMFTWEAFESNRPKADEPDKIPISTPQVEAVTHQTWTMVNISTSGFGLQWQGDTSTHARVGELLAQRAASDEEMSTRWRIGVLRWMQFDKNNTLLCGVQIISPRVIPVTVGRKTNQSTSVMPQVCLMLPEIRPMGQVASLITAAHMFNVDEIVTVQVGGRALKYKLTRLSEQTGSFSQFLIQSTNAGGGDVEIPDTPTAQKKADTKKGDGEGPDKDEFDPVWELF